MAKILKLRRANGSERYLINFYEWQHIIITVYTVIKCFDTLREIKDSMFPYVRKFAHLGICMMLRCLKIWKYLHPNQRFLTKRTYFFKNESTMPVYKQYGHIIYPFSTFSVHQKFNIIVRCKMGEIAHQFGRNCWVKWAKLVCKLGEIAVLYTTS